MVLPLEKAGVNEGAVSGSAAEIAASLDAFRAAGFTQVDLMVGPGTLPAFEALAPVIELLRTERP
jgi:alkanesulfonate monooxygenase SsuD/methylene tetrahydromethanopterin reductase-like flavin-dependent oxidoreductase (luciferase family)